MFVIRARRAARHRPLPPLPWRQLVVAAVAGTAVLTTVVLVDVARTGRHPLNLLQPGASGPSAAAVAADFPETELPRGIGHDGQQFYAIARQPMHLDEVAEALDRPRYRLQRPLYPWLAWVLHPTGGGTGLVQAMFAVGLLALIAGGIATGALAVTLGGPAWLAALFPLLPGSYVALRISTADTLALALLLAALALGERRRPVGATLAAVAAVLAKETMVLPLLGWAVWRRDRVGLAVAGIPAAVAAAWAAALRILVEADTRQVVEFTPWFEGLRDAVAAWAGGEDLWAAATVIATVGLAAAALVSRGLAHPLTWALLPPLLLLPNLSLSAIGLDYNATRIVAPVLVLAAVALATPAAGQEERTQRRQPKRSASGAGRLSTSE